MSATITRHTVATPELARLWGTEQFYVVEVDGRVIGEVDTLAQARQLAPGANEVAIVGLTPTQIYG